MTKTTVYKSVTLVLLFLFSFTIRLIALYQTPYANGWDGYYYIMQMYTFIENGVMRAPDYSLIYTYYIALFYITQDYIVAYKLGSSILAATFTITVYFFAYYITAQEQPNRKKGSNINFIALATALFSIFSPTLTYLTAQFPKNLMGIIFLLWFIYLINRKNIFGAILFFTFTFLTHRMSGVLAFIVLIISLLKKRHLWIVVIVSTLGVIGLSLLPGILHISDFERFKQVIDINFPLVELINYFGTNSMSILWEIELVLLFITFLVFPILLIYKYLNKCKTSKVYIQIFIILLILSLPLFNFQNAGLGFRLYLAFNVLAVLVLPITMHSFSTKILVIISIAIVIVSAISYKSYNPQKLDPPYEDYFQVVKEVNNKIDKKTKLIIAHQGLAQIIITYGSTNATNWQPVNYNKSQRVAANIPYYYYKKHLTKKSLEKVTHLHKSYYLMPEEIWKQFKESVNNSNNANLIEKINGWYNPSKPKPQYLLKGRKKDYIQ